MNNVCYNQNTHSDTKGITVAAKIYNESETKIIYAKKSYSFVILNVLNMTLKFA